MMTVAELRDQLANVDDDVIIVLSSDSKGNSFHEIDSCEYAKYEEGEIMDIDDEDGEDCIVLWPK